MPMGQDPAAQPQEGAQAQPGGMSQLVADTHSNLLKILDAVTAKFPEEAKALQSVVQGYQQVIESLGQAPGAEKQGPPQPGTTTPEAGAANVQPVM
jgi:hypothetical protein